MADFAEKRLNTKFGTFRLLFNGIAPLGFFLDSDNGATVNGVEYRSISCHGKAPIENDEPNPAPTDYRQPYMNRKDFKDASNAARDTVLKVLMPLVADTIKNDHEFMAASAKALQQYWIDNLASKIEGKTAERDKLSTEISELEQEKLKLMLAGPPTL